MLYPAELRARMPFLARGYPLGSAADRGGCIVTQPPFADYFADLSAACAAARRAIGTRYGEAET